jgi:hypothetical protein
MQMGGQCLRCRRQGLLVVAADREAALRPRIGQRQHPQPVGGGHGLGDLARNDRDAEVGPDTAQRRIEGRNHRPVADRLAQKIEWIGAAYEAGQREIEVGSFVPARLLPQLADTAELVAFAKTLPGLFTSVLVPNLRGAESAIAAKADLMIVPLSASHAHSLDTVGYADPAMVRDLFEDAVKIAGDRFWCGHFHDTRGLGLANVYAALEVGVGRFDSSLAGIGGCPHAPGASGNVSTEDLAYMLGSMGIRTGIDIDRLLALRARVAGWLAGETLHGSLWQAGLPKTFGLAAQAVAP